MDKNLRNIFANLYAQSIKEKCLEEAIKEHRSRLIVKSNIKHSTYLRSYTPAYRELLKFFGPDWHLLQMQSTDIENFLSKFNKTPYYKRLIFSVCRTIFKDFLIWNYLIVNPFDSIEKPRISESEIIIIPDDHLDLIMQEISANFKTERSKLINSMLTFLRFSGCRPGEILLIKKRNVTINDFTSTASIVIGSREHYTKTNRSRLVMVCGSAFNSLFDRYHKTKNNDGYLFSNSHKPVQVNTLSKIFKAACKKLKLPDTYHLYCLRATFASELINSGIKIQEISKVLGHTDISTTQRYYSRLDTANYENIFGVINKNKINQSLIERNIIDGLHSKTA